MNSIKTEITPERNSILDVSKDLHASTQVGDLFRDAPPQEEKETYYSEKSSLRQFEAEMFQYDFKSPAELREALRKMWSFQDCEYMWKFEAPVVVAAFKLKSKGCVETNIPAFIYQF